MYIYIYIYMCVCVCVCVCVYTNMYVYQASANHLIEKDWKRKWELETFIECPTGLKMESNSIHLGNTLVFEFSMRLFMRFVPHTHFSYSPTYLPKLHRAITSTPSKFKSPPSFNTDTLPQSDSRYVICILFPIPLFRVQKESVSTFFVPVSGNVLSLHI